MSSPRPTDEQINEGKIFAILSYLGILCVIPLIIKKGNPFVLMHGKQGLVLFVLEVAVFIIHILLGRWFLDMGMFILGILSFVGIIFCLKGEYANLPFISKIADNITL